MGVVVRLSRCFSEKDKKQASNVPNYYKTTQTTTLKKSEEARERKMSSYIKEFMDEWANSQGTSLPRLMGAFFFITGAPYFFIGYDMIMLTYDNPLFIENIKRSLFLTLGQSAFFVLQSYLEFHSDPSRELRTER